MNLKEDRDEAMVDVLRRASKKPLISLNCGACNNWLKEELESLPIDQCFRIIVYLPLQFSSLNNLEVHTVILLLKAERPFSNILIYLIIIDLPLPSVYFDVVLSLIPHIFG